MLDQLKYKAEIAVVSIAIIVLILFVAPGDKEHIKPDTPPAIAESVLTALREQNSGKRLEYAESQPIIKSMAQYLGQFDALMQIDREKARGSLTVIERRLLYLENKGLDVAIPRKILKDFVTKYIANEP